LCDSCVAVTYKGFGDKLIFRWRVQESEILSSRVRAGIAGAVGAIIAFGIAELIHGLYQPVPSVFVSLAQGVVELTPGALVTRGIELLGTADIPVLITTMVIGALLSAALLANISLRYPPIALAVVGVLAAVAVAATFAQPFIAPVATVITIMGALAAGTALTGFLLHAAGLQPSKPAPGTAGPANDPRSPVVRSREAHSDDGVAVGRGGFLLLSGAAAAVGLAALGVGRVLAGQGAQEASTPKPLKLPKASEGSGKEGAKNTEGAEKSTVTHETLPPPDPATSLDVEGIPPLITPAKDFYLIDTELTSPRIDVKTWKLSVKGAVENPFELSYKDLLSMSTREADITLSCVSNEVGGGLVSNGRWTGVLLSEVLAEAGVSPERLDSASQQLVGRSVDGFTTGFRTQLALDGRQALVAFGLNGSELPINHGYPVRLVVPGLYGYVSATKWLTEIELTNWNFDAYWIRRTWSKEGPVKTQSRIDTVQEGESLRAGKIAVGGVAWAPHRGIERVEVSTDGGESWNEARLAAQLAPDTWRQYVYEWEAKPGEYTLKVRATDGEGHTQTANEAPPHPSGATGYHTIGVTVA
jgi:DMSO/TMAO reductase YedYZ molybdopterin-dependent catalytic subunit